MAYHVGGDNGLIVYLESYGDFTHFNVEACSRLEGIGYARSTHNVGLSVECRRAEPE